MILCNSKINYRQICPEFANKGDAATNQLTLVTLNGRDFQGCDLLILDPFAL